MSQELKGKLTNGGGSPLSYYTIKAYDKDPPFDILGDDAIGEAVTLDDGTFKITFRKEDFKKPRVLGNSKCGTECLYEGF